MGAFLPDYLVEFAERELDRIEASEATWAERVDRWTGFDGPIVIPVHRGI